MSEQSSTFNTVHVLDNEIIKASDFEFAFEQLITNVSKATQMFLESNQDFVINGKVLPYEGMNVQVSPIFGVCKSTGVPFGRTETAIMEYGFDGSDSGRVDIIEVQGDWKTYDNQQRAFNDPDTDTQTYQYVDTKKLMYPSFKIKKGVEGSSVAPEVDDGFVKLAEVTIRANASSILESDIHNITSDVAGLDNDDWTTEKDITYNIGYISDINERFRVQHNEDGTHKDNVINTDSLSIGTGSKQVNANVLPIGGAITIPSQAAISATDSILSVITKAVTVITSLYDYYLKYDEYNFKGELCVSNAADANNDLTNPIKLYAAGDGTAVIKIGSSTVLSIDVNGKISTNGYTATANNHIVTKAVTDAISSALSALTTRVENIENTSDTTVYANNTLSSGTDGRYNVDSTSIYVATTQNITLSGGQIIDGVTPTDGAYILVKDQTDAKENGIYQYLSNADWQRVNTFLTPNTLKAKLFTVNNGNTQSGKMYYLAKVNFTDGEAFGSDDINFSEYFGSIKELPNKIVMRDSCGHVKTADSCSDNDAVSRRELYNYNGAIAKTILSFAYPVGTVYINACCDTLPDSIASIGTWCAIDGRFLRACASCIGCTGGGTVTLAKCHLPSHCHSITDHCHSGSVACHCHSITDHYHKGEVGSHCHCMSHNHSMTHGHSSCLVMGYGSCCSGTAGAEWCSSYKGNACTSYQVNIDNFTGNTGYYEGNTYSAKPSFTGGAMCAAVNTGACKPSFTGGAMCAAVNTGNTGSGCSFNVIPAYKDVAMWYRAS